MFDLPPEYLGKLLAALVTTGIGYLGHQIWSRLGDRKQSILESVMAETEAVIHQLVITAPSTTTADQIILWAKGAAAVQLAKVGLKTSDQVVAAMLDAIIANAVREYMMNHPDPQSLSAPIAAKVK